MLLFVFFVGKDSLIKCDFLSLFNRNYLSLILAATRDKRAGEREIRQATASPSLSLLVCHQSYEWQPIVDVVEKCSSFH